MLTGNNTVNVIKGGGGHDVIEGGGAADELEGGSGRDRIEGSAGAFLSYAGSGSRVTVDLSDAETVTLSPEDQILFGENNASVDNVIEVSGGDASGDIATGFDNVIGSNRGGDTLIGDGDANELRGLGGNDTLTGNGGDDTLRGGAGRDTLKGGTGVDTLDGGPGADNLDGGGTDDGGENDVATYANATEGVTVDLSGGNRGRGDAAGDTYTGIELYVGSAQDDVFIAGKDAHNMNGGNGSDTVSYERSEEGVAVALTGNAGTNTQSSTDADNPVDSYARGDTPDEYRECHRVEP